MAGIVNLKVNFNPFLDLDIFKSAVPAIYLHPGYFWVETGYYTVDRP